MVLTTLNIAILLIIGACIIFAAGWLFLSLLTRATGRELLEQNRVRVRATNMRPEDMFYNRRP